MKLHPSLTFNGGFYSVFIVVLVRLFAFVLCSSFSVERSRIALSTDSKNRSLQSFMGSLCGQTTHDALACNCNNRIVDLEKQKKGIDLERAFRK